MKSVLHQQNSAETRKLLYFDLAQEIARASSSESLHRACVRATTSLGYDYYLFGGYYPLVEGIVMCSNYPDEWRTRYDEKGYIAIDPVVKHCWTESTSVSWGKVRFSDGKAGEAERHVMQEAREFGLRSGISIPVHGSGAEGCMLSLVSSEDNVDNDSHDAAGLQIIVHAIHDASKNILAKSDSVSCSVENLSPREIECLSWTAKGKTSWAISRILDVSENTVIFHLRNAIKKLEVTNRSQAVAKAIAHSKITPF